MTSLVNTETGEKRRRENWPHINLGRFDKRYTDAQIDQIIAMHAVSAGIKESKKSGRVVIDGQTERSRKRAS